MRFSSQLFLAACACAAAETVNPHLTLSGDPTVMSVSWSMLVSTQPANSTPPTPPPAESRIRWGVRPDELSHVVTNTTTSMTTLTENLATYDYCGYITETRALHRVRLSGLPTDTPIYYEASISGSTAGAVKGHFQTAPAVPATSLRFLATADMGDSVSKDYTAIPEMVKQCSEPPAEGEAKVELG